MIFEWDEIKEQENIAKHGVSFETARKVFQDPLRIVLEDEKHSFNEERFFYYRAGRRENFDGEIHCAKRGDTNIRSWILAKGESVL